MRARRAVYLIDTDAVSELRKGGAANPGVASYFADAARRDVPLYLSAVTIGELRRGVELVRHRGDAHQAGLLERWLDRITVDYGDNILPFDAGIADLWGRLRVPHPETPLEQQIAATALLFDLTIVTGNVRHFAHLPVRVIDPCTTRP